MVPNSAYLLYNFFSISFLIIAGKHRDVVWQVKWVKDNLDGYLNFYSGTSTTQVPQLLLRYLIFYSGTSISTQVHQLLLRYLSFCSGTQLLVRYLNFYSGTSTYTQVPQLLLRYLNFCLCTSTST